MATIYDVEEMITNADTISAATAGNIVDLETAINNFCAKVRTKKYHLEETGENNEYQFIKELVAMVDDAITAFNRATNQLDQMNWNADTTRSGDVEGYESF